MIRASKIKIIMTNNYWTAQEDDESVNDESTVDPDDEISTSTNLELEIINETDAIEEESIALDEELTTAVEDDDIEIG